MSEMAKARGRAFWVVAGIYALGMSGGTLTIPLYVLWGPQMGFGALTTTLVFASYAVGTALALMLFAALSDRAGRRPLLVASIVAGAVSTVLFLLAGSVAVLLVARFVFGLSTGVLTATATAAMADLAGPRAARRTSIAATAANMGGLGLGTTVAGATAQWLPHPTHLIFWIYLGALAVALAALPAIPETVAHPARPRLVLRRPTLPEDPAAARDVLRVAVAIFAAFAVSGLFSSLVPAFLHAELRVDNLFAIGGEVGLLFLMALVAQTAAPARWLTTATRPAGLLVLGVAAFESGLLARSPALFTAGTLLAGAGLGLAFRRGVQVTQAAAAPDRRADQLATYFLAAYAGSIVPTVGLGLLEQVIDQRPATAVLAAVVIALTAASASPRTTKAPDPISLDTRTSS